MASGGRKVSGETTILTFSYLNEAANLALEQAISKEEGSFYNSLCSIVMSAFCLEAYVNHVGMDRISDWDEFASPLDKLSRITESLGIETDYGKRPFQSIKLTNQFRNLSAHGRTEILPLSYTEKRPVRGKVQRAESRWERDCTIKNARKFLKDLEEVIEMIQGYSDEGPPLGMLSHSQYVKRAETC